MVIINPTREQFQAVCRGAGILPPAWPPKNGWRSEVFMSVVMLSRVWKTSKAHLGERLVLLALADFANDAGEAWPSVETLAKKSNLSERKTRYALRRLEQTGEIKTLRNKGPKGCNVYKITAAETEEEGGANFAGGQSLQGGNLQHEGGNLEHKGGANFAPNPSIEPSKEPSLTPQVASAPSNSIHSDDGNEPFAEFWKAYPRKVGKRAAQRAWEKLKPPLPKVLETIAAFKASRGWRKDGGQFIPHPATWLNRGSWDDELPSRINRESVL